MEGIEVLKGQTLAEIKHKEDELLFTTIDGKIYRMFHSQDCCEYVIIEDICGELGDLIGHPVLVAEEATDSDNPRNHADEYFTWTFYKLSTIKGSVTIRWYGTSNGYYSESVDFVEVQPKARG